MSNMLLVSNPTGFVEQVVLVGDFDALQEIYAAQGKAVTITEYREDFYRLYIKDGEAVERPAVLVEGELRPIAADGVDALHFTVTPAAFTLTVRLDGLIVHQETSESGTLDFAVDQPGLYELTFEAAFPAWPTILTIEAQ